VRPQLLAWLRANPGATATEAARGVSRRRIEVEAELAELEAAGKLRRRVGVAGRSARAVCWFACEASGAPAPVEEGKHLAPAPARPGTSSEEAGQVAPAALTTPDSPQRPFGKLLRRLGMA
jgi:hypothetical protein